MDHIGRKIRQNFLPTNGMVGKLWPTLENYDRKLEYYDLPFTGYTWTNYDMARKLTYRPLVNYDRPRKCQRTIFKMKKDILMLKTASEVKYDRASVNYYRPLIKYIGRKKWNGEQGKLWSIGGKPWLTYYKIENLKFQQKNFISWLWWLTVVNYDRPIIKLTNFEFKL